MLDSIHSERPCGDLPEAAAAAAPHLELPGVSEMVPFGHMLVPDTLARAFGVPGHKEKEFPCNEGSQQSVWWPSFPHSLSQPCFAVQANVPHPVYSPWQIQCPPDRSQVDFPGMHSMMHSVDGLHPSGISHRQVLLCMQVCIVRDCPLVCVNVEEWRGLLRQKWVSTPFCPGECVCSTL